jgi:acetyl-CoA carboxylase beta subunit
MVDMVVDRREMKAAIAKALRFMGASAAQAAAVSAGPPITSEAASR